MAADLSKACATARLLIPRPVQTRSVETSVALRLALILAAALAIWAPNIADAQNSGGQKAVPKSGDQAERPLVFKAFLPPIVPAALPVARLRCRFSGVMDEKNQFVGGAA